MSVRNKADSVFLLLSKKFASLFIQTHVERPQVIRGGDLVVSVCTLVFKCVNVHVRVITKGGSEMP